jgi:hypothetical protein
MRVSKAKHSLRAGIYAVDFAACPEILPRSVSACMAIGLGNLTPTCDNLI